MGFVLRSGLPNQNNDKNGGTHDYALEFRRHGLTSFYLAA